MVTTLLELIPTLAEEVDALINHYKNWNGTWSFQAATEIAGRFIASVTKLVTRPQILAFCESRPQAVVAAAEAGTTLEGAAAAPVIAGHEGHEDCIEKATVLAAFDKFYDTVIAPLDIPFIPDFIEASVDLNVKQLLRTQASALFDVVNTVLHRYVPVAMTAAPGEVSMTADGPLEGWTPF